MNILEHYIVEILSVEPCTEEWTSQDWVKDKNFLTIRVITDCYGCIEERKTVETVEGWERIKDRGYFMW